MRMVKKAAYLAWLLLAGAVFGLFIAGCQTDSPDSDNDNKTENPSDNPADNPSGGNEIGSVFGVYTNPKTGLKYAFNEDGTYSISKNDTSIESGTFKNQNDVTSNIRGIVARAMREQSAKSVKYGYLLTPKNMGGAKASEKNPRNSKITVIKTKNPGAIFGNTPMFTEKDLKEIVEKPAVTVWIQAENLPKVSYNVTSDTTVEKITSAISSKNESSRWFKYYFENCSEISLNVNYGSDTKSFDVANSTVYISKDKNILTEKPENFTFDENYKSSSNKLYLMGTFGYQDEADNAEQIQWKAIDGFNDFKEIDKNIYKLSMYLPQNIYGFKISMPGFAYDYCIPFDIKSSVPKNEWFNVIKSYYNVWYGKNGALATGGGYYNFFLDLSDEANPIMLIATDEQNDKVVEDANLYVVGDFTGWKFDEKYQLVESKSETGIYSLRESVEIPVSKDGKPQGFSISDKTWGAMTGSYGQNWTRTEDIKLLENQYIAVDETYATRTQNFNLEYSFDGTYNFYLNINTSQLKIENPNASTQQIELVGGNVEKVIGTYDVEAGNFYKCTLSGSSAIAGKNVIRSVFRTEAKDSISHGYNDDSSIYFEQYLYAYETGKASLVLKSENAGKILIESVEFENLSASLESDEFFNRFTIAYNNETAFLPLEKTENSNIKECTYFLGANSTFDGIISHFDYRFVLLSNAIDSYPNELTLSEKGDNLVIKNNTDTDLNLTFSLNTGTRKVTLTTEEISAPEFNGNWYSYEIDTTEISDETISLIFNESEANEIGNEIHTKIQSLDITNVQKEGAVYYEWQNSSEAYYKSTRTDKPETNIEAGKLKVFVYTDATAADLHLYYWSESYKERDWPGVTMTPVSTSAGE